VSPASDYGEYRPKTLAEWRRWLRANHAKAPGVWFLTSRRIETGLVPYENAVEEALCWGWIDGQYRPVDEKHAALLFTPRRAGSLWARSNRERVKRLIASGRMQTAGLTKIEAAKRDGTFTLLESAENGVIPPDLKKALTAAKLTAKFDALSMSVKRTHLVSLLTAKRPETRAKRIADIVRTVRG